MHTFIATCMLFLCGQSNKCSSVFPCSSSDWKSIRASLRKMCIAPRFFIMAPQQRWQHVHLSAPTFCTHYIWIKVIEWIDLSELASGHASRRRSPRLLFACVLRVEKRAADRICYCHRWSPEPSCLTNGGSAPLSVHPHRAPTDTAGAFTDDSPRQQVSPHWTRSTPRLNETLRFLFWWGRWAERFNGNMEP